MQVDSQKLATAAAFWGHDVWSIPLIIIVGSYQLYTFLGWSALIGVASLVRACCESAESELGQTLYSSFGKRQSQKGLHVCKKADTGFEKAP